MKDIWNQLCNFLSQKRASGKDTDAPTVAIRCIKKGKKTAGIRVKRKPARSIISSLTSKTDPIEEVLLDTAILMVNKKVNRKEALDVFSTLLAEERKRVETDTYSRAVNAVSQLNTNAEPTNHIFGFGKH